MLVFFVVNSVQFESKFENQASLCFLLTKLPNFRHKYTQNGQMFKTEVFVMVIDHCLYVCK